MSQEAIISRLAPTPSGYLHEGNVFNFIVTWLAVRSKGGQLHLRIDDLDKARVKRPYIDFIFRTLDWLGMDYDFGPSGTEDFLSNYSQRLHLDEYYKFISRLEQRDLVFNCDCSRKEIKQINELGHYSGQCLKKGNSYKINRVAQRMNTDRAGEFINLDDAKAIQAHMSYFIIRRKDGVPAYQVASVVDDIRMNVNYIVRGEDLRFSTLAQQLLAAANGASSFNNNVFIEHPLITKGEAKLSKSQQSAAITFDHSSKMAVFEKVSEFLNLQDASDTLQGLLAQLKAIS